MQNEKLKKFTDFFGKYRRYFCAAVLFVILVVILVKCTGPQKDQKETQNGTQGVTQTTKRCRCGTCDTDGKLLCGICWWRYGFAGDDCTAAQ